MVVLLAAAIGCASAGNSPQGCDPAGPRPSTAQPQSQGALLDAIAFAAVQDGAAPIAGMAVEVVQRGQVLLRRGYGFANLEGRLPMPADAIFRIGSVTKQFTAAAIMRLAQSSRLSLGDPVGKYVADLPPHVAALTVRQLLNQTTGLANYTELPWFQNPTRPVAAPELLARVAAQPLAFQPGTQFQYSNSNFYLLGLVIEKLTGRPYQDVVRTELAAPAGLTDTAMCPPEPVGPRSARGYRHAGRSLLPALPLLMDRPFSAGGLCSTVDDLVAWARALGAGQIVGTSAYAEMTSPPTLASGQRSAYGFGLFIGELGGHRRIRHGGGINGFSSQLERFPDDDLTIAVLANTESGVPAALAERLACVVLGVPEPVIADLPISAEEAAPLVGRYTIPALGQTLTVAFQKGELRLQHGGPGLRLRSQGDGLFAAPELRARLRFHVTDGHAATITIEQSGQTFEATRLPDVH